MDHCSDGVSINRKVIISLERFAPHQFVCFFFFIICL